MGNEVECADSRHVEIKKKSKKNKNMTDDPLLFGDENSQVETDGDHSKKKKKDKHREKKRKSELKEDGDEDQHDNGNLVTDDLPKKKRDKHKEKKRKSESKEDEDEDQHDNGNLVTDDLPKKKRDKHRKREKRKSESKEDGDEDQHDKGNLVNDDLQMKKDKKRKRRSSEKAEIKENEPGQNAGPDVQKDSDPKPKKKKKKKTDVVKGTGISMNGCPEEMFKKTDKKKKKKKIDSRKLDADKAEEDCDPKPEKKKKKKTDVVKGTGISINDCSEMFKKTDEKKKKKMKKKKTDEQNLDTDKTEEFTLKTRDREDKSAEKQKVRGRLKNKAIESDGNKTDKPKAKSKSKSKRVSFSGHVEVFPTPVTEREKQATKKDGLLRGKRFTPEEDEIVKQAVLDYIAANGLGDDGLKMVLTCRSHKGMKNCWKEIGICLPYRPSSSVYYRAHILFERAEDRAWTPEEIELVREYQKEHGNAWKKIAQELGKHRFHVKDTWRRIRLENSKKGKWSQEEYQNLFDLVNLDLQMKVKGEEDKMSKHGMLRDNIPWMAISDKLSTRTNAICCLKWYGQLTSSLVLEKKWCDADDYRMIGALYEIDAACVEDVDWDNVLEHRPGEICLKRWSQMVKHIGDYRSKSFGEQVDILAKRYCPDLAETREAWDNKPIVT